MAKAKSASTRKEFNLRRALRSKIGRVCYFTNPENGEVIEGTYGRGRKVKRMVGMRRFTEAEMKEQEAVGGFMIDEQTFTVPSNVKITFGARPHTPAAGK